MKKMSTIFWTTLILQSLTAYAVAPKIMSDGTPSFQQPPTTGWLGQGGKCGQTAAANFLYMVNGMCPDGANNATIVQLCSGDPIGVTPPRLTACLQKTCVTPVCQKSAANSDNPIADLSGNLPAVVLLAWQPPGGAPVMHWVTVVSADSEQVCFNDQGRQTCVLPGVFLSYWNYTRCNDSAVTTFSKLNCGPGIYICTEDDVTPAGCLVLPE